MPQFMPLTASSESHFRVRTEVGEDNVTAFDSVFVIAPGFSVLEQGYTHFLACQAQGFDVFNLCFDCGEVTHGFIAVFGNTRPGQPGPCRKRCELRVKDFRYILIFTFP